MAEMTLVKAGFYTTIQDAGRTAFRAAGVPHSGAMDQQAMRYVNNVLGNPWDAPVLEMTLTGITCLFTQPARIAISGATAMVLLNRQAVQQHEALQIKTGDLLSIGLMTAGNYCYLAIQGGFQTESVLGSVSFYKGITAKDKLVNGDVLIYESHKAMLTRLDAIYKLTETTLKAYAGVAYHKLTKPQQEQLLTTVFTVSKNWGRMAFQLSGVVQHSLEPIKSTPVLPGTVQLTPAGTLVVLMRDAQTTGGYSCILQLTEDAINKLAQTRVGSAVRFVVI